MTATVHMVTNGTVGKHAIVKMGSSNNLEQRIPCSDADHCQFAGTHTPILHPIAKPIFAGDVDWFVWEPIDSAHIVRCDGYVPIPRARLDAIVLPMGMPTTLRVPFGRYCEAFDTVTIQLPCTLRQLMYTIRGAYMRPATAKDVAAVRATECEHGDSNYTRTVDEVLKKGEAACLLDLCGSQDYSAVATDQGPIMTPSGTPRKEAKLTGRARRHPLGDAMGLVRFEGVHEGQGPWLEAAIGS